MEDAAKGILIGLGFIALIFVMAAGGDVSALIQYFTP